MGAVSADGLIGGGGVYGATHRAMIEHAKQTYLLVDHDKIDVPTPMNSATFADVTGVISDYAFSEETKKRYPTTVFYQV